MTPRVKLTKRKTISTFTPRPTEDKPKTLVVYSDNEDIIFANLGITNPSEDVDGEVSKETPTGSDDEEPPIEEVPHEAAEDVAASSIAAENDELPPYEEADEEAVEVDPLLSMLTSELSKTPDRKQKGLMVAEQKPSLKKGTSSVKLLSEAIKSGTVSSRSRLERKNPDILFKSSTQSLGKKTKETYIIVTKPSDFICQDEIDFMLAYERPPKYDPSNRQIAVSRHVDFRLFAANDLNLTSMFEDLGLKNLCESCGEASVEKIREFYASMIVSDGETELKYFKTSVGGKKLIFSTYDVNALYEYKNHPPPAELDKNQADSVILGRKVGVKNYMQSTKLNLKLMVLHRAVLLCLLPWAGSMDTITTIDACVMAQLLKGIPINMGFPIFDHMRKCQTKSDKALPFGHVVADFLRLHDIDANTLNENDKWKVGHFESSTINIMQYVHTSNGWKPKAEVKKPLKYLLKTFACYND